MKSNLFLIIQKELIGKRYQEKLLLNDTFDNFFKSKDSMVNLEGLTINKYINKNELFSYEHCNEENNFFYYMMQLIIKLLIKFRKKINYFIKL